MRRRQRFAFAVEVSLDFLAAERHEPVGAAAGPGHVGLAADLVPTPPDDWRVSLDPFWRPNAALYVTKRYGEYVRPSRVRLVGDADATYGSFTIPVRDGRAMLPDGRTVQTPTRFVVVPVPPPI